MILIACLIWPANAFAVHYAFPAKETVFANLLIVPIALLLFILSGAYFYYNREANEAGTKRIGFGLPAFLIVLSIGGAIFSGAVTLFLIIYAWSLAIKMLRIKKDTAGPYTCRISPVAGGILMLITAFLATFPFVFSYGSYWARHARWILDEGMPGFAEYQTAYAKDHDGVYRETVQAAQDKITFIADPDEDKSASNSALHQFNSFCDQRVIRCSIAYGPDLKSYEVRLTPMKLLPWPYGYFDSPRAFYMNQTEIIRYEAIKEPGQEASASSKPFNKRML